MNFSRALVAIVLAQFAPIGVPTAAAETVGLAEVGLQEQALARYSRQVPRQTIKADLSRLIADRQRAWLIVAGVAIVSLIVETVELDDSVVRSGERITNVYGDYNF